MNSFWHYDSPLGRMRMASDGAALTGLWFEDTAVAGWMLHPAIPADAGDSDAPVRWLPVFEETCRWLECYFNGFIPDFTPPLAPQGTPFRQAVWEILLTIPYGKTMTYGEIAKRLTEQAGVARMSAQAVGGAVRHNPISLIVPCHRVVGAGGALTGYAGGLDRKARLLRLEGAML